MRRFSSVFFPSCQLKKPEAPKNVPKRSSKQTRKDHKSNPDVAKMITEVSCAEPGACITADPARPSRAPWAPGRHGPPGAPWGRWAVGHWALDPRGRVAARWGPQGSPGVPRGSPRDPRGSTQGNPGYLARESRDSGSRV